MRNEIEIAARERFGEPNRAASSSTELRFGRNGSKSVELTGERAGSWFDFETEEGGHLIDTSAPVIEPPQMRLDHCQVRLSVCGRRSCHAGRAVRAKGFSPATTRWQRQLDLVGQGHRPGAVSAA